MRISLSFIVAFAVVGIAGGAYLSQSTGGATSSVLCSVDDTILSQHYDLDIFPDEAGTEPALDRDAALAAVAEDSPARASAPVKEAVLAHVRTTLPYLIEYEGRAWVVSLAIVPPFSGGPIPVGQECVAPPLSKYTVDNTFFIYLIDAESGEVLRVFGGPLEPDTP